MANGPFMDDLYWFMMISLYQKLWFSGSLCQDLHEGNENVEGKAKWLIDTPVDP